MHAFSYSAKKVVSKKVIATGERNNCTHSIWDKLVGGGVMGVVRMEVSKSIKQHPPQTPSLIYVPDLNHGS